MRKVMSLKEVKAVYGEDREVSVYTGGWIRSLRQSKNVGFIEIYDGTLFGSVQCVIGNQLHAFETMRKLTTGSCIIIEGVLKSTDKSEKGFEISVSNLEIEGKASQDYPIQKKEHGFEYLRTVPHLRARTQTFNAIFKVRSILTRALLSFLESEDFVWIQSPAITTTDAEGGGEVFRLTTLDTFEDPTKDFFGKAVFMSVTGQLNLEPFIGSYRNVFTFGPSFRAEHSNTTRHVAEFWQIEPEMAFVDLELLMDTIEAMTSYTVRYVLEHCEEELQFLESKFETGLIEKLEACSVQSFERIDYSDAITLLGKVDGVFKETVSWETGLFSEHERYLTDVVYKKPIFITNYPREQKAFYMRLNDDGKTVGATDLLFPKIGEIVGASEREERFDLLEDQIQYHKLDQESYQWYLDSRKYGSVRHGGFGIGIERLLRYITGVENIRDVIPYPRTPGHAEF